MSLIALDPGTRGCGVAYFRDGLLESARYVRNPVLVGDDLDAVVGMTHAISLLGVNGVVAERMQIYKVQKRGRRNPNDLIPLAAIVGGVAACIGGMDSRWFVPHDWKGSMPKAERGEEYIVERRVKERLSDEERSRINAVGSLSHNVYDAIGIGLFHLGRFNKRRVIAR